jgi:hypothetical protein
MRLKLNHRARLAVLALATAFVFTLARAGEGSWWDFLGGWFAHLVAVLLLGIVAAASITRFHKFFLGRPPPWPSSEADEVGFYVLMTLLVAAIAMFMLMNLGPNPDD